MHPPATSHPEATDEYETTMSRVYSGFDRLCIEDIEPWRTEDEKLIESWLARPV